MAKKTYNPITLDEVERLCQHIIESASDLDARLLNTIAKDKGRDHADMLLSVTNASAVMIGLTEKLAARVRHQVSVDAAHRAAEASARKLLKS